MNNPFKNCLSILSLFSVSYLSAQTYTSVKQYPQMYEASVNSIGSNSVPEKSLLTPKELLDINLNGIKSDPVLKNANWGFVVYDPKTEKIISSFNEETSLVPASTTKLLTTETAMNLLGENFKWTTQLEYSGEIDGNGELNGNLYIVGSGDPTLGTGKAGSLRYGELVTEFVQSISQKNGIKKINGDIIIQNAIFKENKLPSLPENIVWLEHNNYYLPVGTTKNIEPRNEKMVSKSNSVFEKSKKYFYVSPYIHKIVFTEEYLGADFTTKLPDAPYYFANALRTNLIKNGISVKGKVITKLQDQNPEPRKLMTSYQSPTLGEIIKDTNHRSDNVLAEALLRHVGYQKLGDLTPESGKNVVIEHLSDSGFLMEGFNYSDGSGLSRNNKVTPISQAKFLSSLLKTKYFNTFFETLPTGGQSGTLKKMFVGEGFGLVHAKTGTLNKVKTLAGFIKTYSGRTLVFSLLINDYSGSVNQVKNKMEDILESVLNL